MAKINILYIIWSLGPGGAEKVVAELAKGLDKTRYNPAVCCLNWPGEYAKEVEEAGVPVIALQKRPKLDISIVGKIARLIKQQDIHIVHTHLWTANFWGRIAAVLARTPVIISTEHGISQRRGCLGFGADRILSLFTDRITFVSENMKNEFWHKVAWNLDKVKIIYNGIDMKEFEVSLDKDAKRREFGIERGDFTISCIGRLSREKGHRYLLHSLGEIRQKHPQVKALIVGAGKEEPALRQLKEALRLNGCVVFTGFRNDIPEILAISDLVVIPSEREAHPLVALEAMACGIPVIATDTGGMNEIILHNKTGILIPASDSKRLAESIENLLQEPSLRERLARAGKEKAKELFTLNQMIMGYQQLYETSYKDK